MSEPPDFIEELLAEAEPWSQLSEERRRVLASRFRPQRYELGQVIVSRHERSDCVYLVARGRARTVVSLPGSTTDPVSLEVLARGQVFGWASLAEACGGETVVSAAEETVCLALPGADFRTLLEEEPALREAYRQRPALLEVFELLAAEFARRAIDPGDDLRALAIRVLPQVRLRYDPGNGDGESVTMDDYVWLVSAGGSMPRGSRWVPSEPVLSNGIAEPSTRLAGFPESVFDNLPPSLPRAENGSHLSFDATTEETPRSYPVVRGSGELEGALACFEMACRHFEQPFRRDVVRRVLANQLDRSPILSLRHCGAIAELAGLNAQWIALPPTAFGQIEPPALVRFENRLAVLLEIDRRGDWLLACPETGLRRMKTAEFFAATGGNGEPREVLLLQAGHPADEDGAAFGLRWFWPAVRRHRRALGEVLVASFFVQLFTLANPLLTQVIIDKVLVQNAADTLHVLGALLVIVAFFGALLTGLRTYLFVDTTNRIDLSLGSAVIHRLYRLSLAYFQKRPVGELATRVGELENIRHFLTGTALTVVLDAVFSVIYLAVMLAYSVPLTAAALGAVPLLCALTLLSAPFQRRQLRVRAERYAATQSYLVETLGGIATIKAQNLEPRARWNWQERYARFVSASFRTVLTSTGVGAFGGFLSRMSDLAVLWFGAMLVLDHRLTLGQLIAFRIIAGYVTSPLMRLAQSWQQFQEVGLSIERLGDILDAPREQGEKAGREHIPLPPVEGAVEFRDVTFAYVKGAGAPQLRDVSFGVAAGAFVGVVGQSGSGKSTLLKLVPRLYSPDAGRIFLDHHDIGKVELYSLRRQIGTVLQDSLLFDGTVRENIALADEDASAEAIVAAAKVAAAHDFIMSLPEGYNSRVGEGGRALSGGQRQRIAIARVVLQNPRLLILDEATSALDFATERQVCRNLAAEFKGRTVFFVTHRLRSVQSADLILFLDNGVIAERGTHEELLALNGRYAALHSQQDAAT